MTTMEVNLRSSSYAAHLGHDRVANRQQCGQRSLVRTGWLDGYLRVWVTKATCIRSLILLSTRAISLLLLLILSLNNAIIYSSHMFN